MARLQLRIGGQIRAGNKWILAPGGEIDSPLAQNLDVGPGLIQILRQRGV